MDEGGGQRAGGLSERTTGSGFLDLGREVGEGRESRVESRMSSFYRVGRPRQVKMRLEGRREGR